MAGFLVSIMVLKKFENPTKRAAVIARKVCAGILIVCFLVIVCINVACPSYYVPTEWNFNYWKTGMLRFYKKVNNTPEGSELRRICLETVPGCKADLEQYAHNGTIPDY